MDEGWLADKSKSIDAWMKKPPIGGCLHAGGQCDSPIASHLVSRCVLDSIATDGHVIQLSLPPVRNAREYKESPDDALLDMVDKKIGVRKKASTFPGFCSACDAEVFRPIDTLDLEVTRKNLQLLCYRAISQATAIKYQMTAATLSVKQHEWEYQESMTTGVQLMMQYVEVGGMQEAVKEVIAGSKDPFRHVVVILEGKLPFATAGAFQPYISANGKRLE